MINKGIIILYLQRMRRQNIDIWTQYGQVTVLQIRAYVRYSNSEFLAEFQTSRIDRAGQNCPSVHLARVDSLFRYQILYTYKGMPAKRRSSIIFNEIHLLSLESSIQIR